jgi:hypothetical protein
MENSGFSDQADFAITRIPISLRASKFGLQTDIVPTRIRIRPKRSRPILIELRIPNKDLRPWHIFFYNIET